MKKILLITLGICTMQFAKAQKHLTPDQLDKAIASKAAVFALKADKNILDLNESTVLRVQVLVYDKPPAEAGPNDVNFDVDYDYDTSNPSTEPYKITNWRILESGAGHISGTNEIANFIAPASMPASKTATVVVDLIPNKPGLPKIELEQVIYIEDAPMAFTFDAPAQGINHEKYTFTSTTNTMNQLAGMTLPPGASAAQMQQMAALQAQLAQVRGQANAALASKGFDGDAMMSNAKGIYTAQGDITVMTIMGNAKVTKDGKDAGTKNVMITLTFPGKNAGIKTIKLDKAIAAHIIINQTLTFGCANDPKSNPTEKGIHCSGGTINVASYNDKQIKGTVHAQLEGYQGNGTLDGKFVVAVASK